MVIKKLATLAGMLAVFSLEAWCAPVFFENFDTTTPIPYGTVNPTYPIIIDSNFTLIGGSIDVVGNQGGSYAPWICNFPGSNSSGNCVDLNGMNAGTLQSIPIPVVKGFYVLSFVLNGSQRQDYAAQATVQITLSVDGALLPETFTFAYTELHNESIQFYASTDETVTLTFTGDPTTTTFPAIATGLILDNVWLDPIDPNPEPSTFAMLLAVPALYGLSRLRRRKR